MNLISVIIPVYNGEKYIKRCINSLINQTYKNIEIIIINDGSKDNSINIIKEISEKDKRIIIIDKENQGVSIARNAGIEKASGDYIMFVDVDDWVKTNMIEQMYKVIKKENVDIVKCNSINEFNNKATENKISNSLVNKVLKKEEYKNEILNLISNTSKLNVVWGQLMKKEIVEDIRFEPNIEYGEDLLFNVLCMNKVKSLYFVNEYYYHYYINDIGVCRNYSEKKLNKKIQDVIYIYPKIQEIVYNWDEKFVKGIEIKFIKELLENILRLIVVCKSGRKYKNYIKNILLDSNYKKCVENLNLEDISKLKYKFKKPLKLLYFQSVNKLYLYAKCIYKPIRILYKKIKK